jgi:hypothetical protein
LATGRRETDLIRLPASTSSEPSPLGALKASTNYRKLPEKLSYWFALDTKVTLSQHFKKERGDEDVAS